MHFTWEVLIQQGVSCTWETLYVGRQLHLVTPEDLTSFAVHVLANSTDEVDENLVELSWSSEDADERVSKLLKSQIDEGSDAWNIELAKIRYGLLMELRTKTNDPREIQEGVELIYSHVGYPPSPPSLHTRDENEIRLFRLMDDGEAVPMMLNRDERIPEFHTVPLEKIYMHKGLVIEFDDIEEQRWKLIFKPYQAFRVVGFDCSEFAYKIGPFLYEILDSEWVEELKRNLVESSATFMEKAHHYIMAFGDHVVEVVAWEDYVIERDEQQPTTQHHQGRVY